MFDVLRRIGPYLLLLVAFILLGVGLNNFGRTALEIVPQGGISETGVWKATGNSEFQIKDQGGNVMVIDYILGIEGFCGIGIQIGTGEREVHVIQNGEAISLYDLESFKLGKSNSTTFGRVLCMKGGILKIWVSRNPDFTPASFP